MNYLEARQELIGKKTHFKTGSQDVTLKEVERIMSPADLKMSEEREEQTKGLLFVAEGKIESKNFIKETRVQVYVYPHTEIFIKLTGDKNNYSGGTIAYTMPLRQ
ncbi:MAG: hypothetical protein V1892_00220 [bacterium]